MLTTMFFCFQFAFVVTKVGPLFCWPIHILQPLVTLESYRSCLSRECDHSVGEAVQVAQLFLRIIYLCIYKVVL
jgi:hypothetical protein